MKKFIVLFAVLFVFAGLPSVILNTVKAFQSADVETDVGIGTQIVAYSFILNFSKIHPPLLNHPCSQFLWFQNL